MPETRIGEALAEASRAGVDRIDAQWLLATLLARPRAWLLANDDQFLGTEQLGRWQTLLSRLVDGEPLAYLVGWQEFHGLRLRVDPAVLVPRPDTETLVDWALESLGARPADGPPPRVLDLGTGSGAIALALKHAHPGADIVATDASAAALAVAIDNGTRLGLGVSWRRGDWWEALDGDTRFDLIVSNPPYIAEGDVHLPALHHEPRAALAAGQDGLDDLRAIVSGASRHLVAGGRLLLEHGWDQACAVGQLLRAAGFEDVEHRSDLAGRQRCSGGRRPL